MNPHPKPQEDVVGLIAKLRKMIQRAELAEASRRALIREYNTDYSDEADRLIRAANDEKMVAGALLSAAAVDSLPILFAAVEQPHEAGRRDMREGWVLVPREPTQAMCVAGWRKGDEFNVHMGNGGAARIWEAMLGAVPTELLGGEQP